MLFFLVGKKPYKPDFFLIVGAGLWARPCLNARRIWASTPQIADYTDYADCADFKRIAVCSCAIYCASDILWESVDW